MIPPESLVALKAATAELLVLLDRAPALPAEDRQAELLLLLSRIDVACLSLPDVAPEFFDDHEVERADLRDKVSSAFPEFGFYSFIRPDPPAARDHPGVNDAVDDLTEIISDLQEALRYEALEGVERAVWEVREAYRTHFGSHLVDLRSYAFRMRFLGL